MSSLHPWHIAISPRAQREMRKLPASDAQRIGKALESVAERRPTSDVQKVKSKVDEWRLRVGDWRVFIAYIPEKWTIYVLYIRHRREAYR